MSAMPVRKVSEENRQGLRVAGLILRRNPEREFHNYIPLLPYQPSDYQILLRTWPTPPFKGYLGTFSGPAISGQDPQDTLVEKMYNWTRRLGQQAKLGEDVEGVRVRRAEFISVHGGGERSDPLSGNEVDMGITLCYVLPTTTRDSSLVSRYLTSPDYPKFYNLKAVLRGMMSSGDLNVHPYTREMLSALDKWLREQHALAGYINFLFSQSLESRLKMYVPNPLHTPLSDSVGREKIVGTPNVTGIAKREWPIMSSTPFQHPSEDSTLYETTAFSMAKLNDTIAGFDRQPSDMVVKNPLFGSGLKFSQVDVMVVNQYFGKGTPDYDSLGEKRGKWSIHVEGDGMPDWIDQFPMHKCACEGDEEGVRRCVKIGVSPDERDTDSWTALHYACWYGELGVVKVLVEESSADLGITNNFDSTPLHLAAATGHSEVVAYLLQQPGIHYVQATLDNEGKSPLAVCLECRQNDWSETVKLLREAYKSSMSQSHLTRSPSLFSHPSPPHNPHKLSPESIPSQNDLESLSDCGSLARKEAVTGKRSEKVVRRQRVDFTTGQHQLAHFCEGKDTPTTKVLQAIYHLIQLAPQYHNVLALCIQSTSLEIQLGDSDKPLQLMSTWPTLLSRHVTKMTSTEAPSLWVKRNVFFSPSVERLITDPTILEMLYTEARSNVLTGKYPCTVEEAITLGGLSMQISYGDHTPMVHNSGFLQEHLDEVLPVTMVTSRRRVQLEWQVLTEHSKISREYAQSDEVQLQKMYLQKCWQSPFYGAAFFPGSLATKSSHLPPQVKLGHKAHLPVSIAVNTFGFHLISKETNSLLISLSYEAVEWDVSSEKHQLLLFKKDKSLHIIIQTKMTGLLYSLVSNMTDQYLCGSHGNTSTPPTP